MPLDVEDTELEGQTFCTSGTWSFILEFKARIWALERDPHGFESQLSIHWRVPWGSHVASVHLIPHLCDKVAMDPHLLGGL